MWQRLKRLLSLNADIKALGDRLEPIAAQTLGLTGLIPIGQSRALQSALQQEIAALRARVAQETPENPAIYGFKAYAQTDEDGIFENIFSRIPRHGRTFIEIGCGRGIENNSHYLALKGYRGCWVDGSDKNIAFIEAGLGGLKHADLLVEKQFVSRDNIVPLVARYCSFLDTREPGLFSLDIDGNDLHVLREAMKSDFAPAVICIEYNPKFPPPLAISMAYNAEHTWSGDDYHGASLQAFCDLLTGYRLVSCNLSGANAFFVRNDLARPFKKYTPGQLYQPFREHLIELRSEHAPSLRWLRDKIGAR